jgi:hypothetical protein
MAPPSYWWYLFMTTDWTIIRTTYQTIPIRHAAEIYTQAAEY